MIFSRAKKKYTSEGLKLTSYNFKKHQTTTKKTNFTSKVMSQNYHKFDVQTTLKSQFNSQINTNNYNQNCQIHDQNNSILANQISNAHQLTKKNNILGSVNQQKILQLINAYPTSRQQNNHKRENQNSYQQHSKIHLNKKIKIIKKQFSQKKSRQKLKLMRKNKISGDRKFQLSIKGQSSSSSAESSSNQTYTHFDIYRDFQIFPEELCEFTTMTVTHRIDNDIDSDDEQVERAVAKMTGFLNDSIRTAKFVERMNQQHEALMNQQQSS